MSLLDSLHKELKRHFLILSIGVLLDILWILGKALSVRYENFISTLYAHTNFIYYFMYINNKMVSYDFFHTSFYFTLLPLHLSPSPSLIKAVNFPVQITYALAFPTLLLLYRPHSSVFFCFLGFCSYLCYR